MRFVFNNENNKEYQNKFNNLMKEIFFDFGFWLDLNLWDENYESYAIEDNGQLVSNVCVYKTNIIFRGIKYSALSVGGVATKPEYRKKGLLKTLIEKVIKKYENTPMYLCANNSVIDFYPKFGFERVYEKLPVVDLKLDNEFDGDICRKLQYDDKKVWEYIYKRNVFSKNLDCLNTQSINMFHLYSGQYNDSIFELAEINTLIIAKKKNDILKIFNVYCKQEVEFNELLKNLPFKGVKRIEFGFMPYWENINYRMEEYKTDPIFVKNLKCKLGDFKFPEFSIT